MTRWVVLAPAPAEDATEIASRLTTTLSDLPGVHATSAGADLPGSFGGLGLSWDVTTDVTPSTALADAGLAQLVPGSIDAAPLQRIAGRHVPMVGKRVKRTLLLGVHPGTSADAVTRFEADLTAMPDHITTIRSWMLSRVQGHSTWTHAWEQEFSDVDGLLGEYMQHPYHWAHVDRWFDPEVPDSIVAPQIAHIFRWTDDAVLPG